MSEPGDLVDLERVVVQHLLDVAAIAAIAGDNVSTELARDFVPPWLQVTRLPGTFVDARTNRLERGVVQVQAWGATKAEAWDLAAAAARALKAITEADLAGLGAITEATWQQTPWWNPDPEADTPRYTMTIALWAHPAASAS